jgi:hypothetical protein
MLSVSMRLRSVLLASAAALIPGAVSAQSALSTSLPAVTVDAPAQQRAAAARKPRNAAPNARTARSTPAATPASPVGAQAPSVPGALTVLTAQQALREIQQTPGGVALVTADAWRTSTPSNTIKDILDYVPGVFAQPKWGDDTRLSIRGSSLSRNFHLRGVQLYMDGIPINTADGYGDFQEIDPTAYKYVEVFKGGNALRFGANSLGGAINFVTPTGRDPFPNGASVDMGAFGFRRLQANTGGANGPWDGFITASTQSADGFRDHSYGEATRVSGNVGYQFSPDFETRFYLNANSVRQRIPGSVSKDSALNSPTTAAARQSHRRPAAQHRHRAPRQQDHHPSRQHHDRLRRLRRRPAPDASDLPVSGLQLSGLWRLREGHRRPQYRRLSQRVRRRRQCHQRPDRQQPVCQCRGPEGRAGVVIDRPFEEHVGLCRELALCAAHRRIDWRHAIPLCHAQPSGPFPERWRPIGRHRIQPVESERRIALEYRSDLAGLREYLAQCRSAELRREFERPGHPDDSLHQHPATACDHL